MILEEEAPMTVTRQESFSRYNNLESKVKLDSSKSTIEDGGFEMKSIPEVTTFI
jgi:hypothetical protein